MFSRRPFLSAVILSLSVHLFILLRMPGFSLIPHKADSVQVEVKYIEPKKDGGQALARPKARLKNKQDPLFKLPSVVVASAVAPAPSAPPSPVTEKQELSDKKKEVGRLGSRMLAKPALLRPDISAVRKKITLAAPRENQDLNKVNSPSYIGYFQLTREKVKRILYQRYTYAEEGEVYISFIVSNDGNIKAVRINDERSTPSPYLREIAIASVRESSPFPAFPKDLEYPELSFNVVVSFEVE